MSGAPKTAIVHQTWSSKATFMLATAGAAVGLGNLWRFPFITGQNGGAAFLIVYIAFVFLIAVPIITSELTLGRMGHLSPIGSVKKITKAQGKSKGWHAIGVLSLLVPFLGFTYYSVVAGWSLEYAWNAISGAFGGLESQGSLNLFGGLIGAPGRTLLLQGLVIYLTVIVVGGGLHNGIERATKVLMPALFLILLVMIGYNLFYADMTAAVSFLFTPDFSKLTGRAVLEALGQAFFSVGVGVGFMMTYGAYLPKETSVPKAAAVIAGLDTLVALLAGLAIFPIVFAAGLNPGEGPGLVFVTMPVAFGGMAVGQFLGVLFFLLLFFAAFTSTIAMLEPVVCWLEEKLALKRFWMAFGAGTAIWMVGILPSLSGNILHDVRPLQFIPAFADKDVFGTFDFFVASFLIPINALLISLFVGWVINQSGFKEQLNFQSRRMFKLWHILLRYIAPLAVAAITVFGLMS